MPDNESAERYLYVRKRLGLSQNQLAKRLGLKVGATVSAWERGEADPKMGTARRLAELGGVSVEWLLSGKGAVDGTTPNVIDYIGRGRRVPKIGDFSTRVTAVAKRRSSDFVMTHFACSDKSYALQVVGDSMVPDLHPGDVVVCDPAIAPAPGDFVHVELNDGSILFRKYRPTSVRGKPPSYELVPSNPDWPIVQVGPSNPGKITGVMSERIVPRRKQ